MSSNWVWQQIIFCSKWNFTFLLFAITLAWKWQIASPLEDVHSRWSSIYANLWEQKRFLHKKRVQPPQDLFGTLKWPPFHCFGTSIWPPWRHVKALYYEQSGLFMETKCCPSYGGTMSQMMEKRINRSKKKGVLQKSTWVFTPKLILCSSICEKRWLFMRLSIIIVKRSN